MNNRRENSIGLSSVIAILLLAVVILGCRPTPPTPSNDNGSASPSVSPSPVAASRMRRFLVNVFAGDRNKEPLAMLSDDAWHEIAEETHVRTDDNGEGWLKLHECMLVYVFQKSQMVTAPCSKAELATGSINCQLAGTAVYNNSCEARAKQIIQTPTAEIRLNGTWLSVTYLPDRQITLTLVLQGSATVTPITDISTHSLGQPVEVQEGQFFYTVPDEKLNADGDVAGNERKARSLEDSGSLAAAMLSEWMDRLRKRAEQDGMPPRYFPEPSPSPASPEAIGGIDCDCNNVEAGILTKQYQAQCRQVEANLRSQFKESGGKVIGLCDAVTSGPNARPKPQGQIRD